jgi:hypothetical protein
MSLRARTASRYSEEGVRLARLHKQRGVEADALRVQGDAASLEADGRSRAEQAYRESLALATGLGLKPLAEICRVSLDRLGARVDPAGGRLAAVTPP